MASTMMLPMVIATGPPAVAADCGITSAYFVGSYSAHSSTVYGAKADIIIPNTGPTLCTGSSFSDAWTMVTSHNRGETPTSSNGTWAQIGFGKDYLADSGDPNVFPERRISFAQFTKPCKPNCDGEDVYTNVFAAPALGATITYANYLRSSDNHIHMYADGVQYLETGYDPGNYWDPAWAGQFFNESRHSQSDTWGTPTDKMTFYRIQKYDSAGNIDFIQQLTTNNDVPGRYNVTLYDAAVGGKGMKVWTD